MGNVIEFKRGNMTALLDTLKQYSEFMIEYDVEDNMVYISGLTKDKFWDEIIIEEDIAEPESYSWGYHDALKSQGIFSTVTPVEYED